MSSMYSGMLATGSLNQSLFSQVLSQPMQAPAHNSQFSTSPTLAFGVDKDNKSEMSAHSTAAIIALLRANLQNITSKPTAPSAPPPHASASCSDSANFLRTKSVSTASANLFQALSTNSEGQTAPAKQKEMGNTTGFVQHAQPNRTAWITACQTMPVHAGTFSQVLAASRPAAKDGSGFQMSQALNHHVMHASSGSASTDAIVVSNVRQHQAQRPFDGASGAMQGGSFAEFNTGASTVSTNALRRVRKRARSILKNDWVPRDAKRKTKGCALSTAKDGSSGSVSPGAEP